LTLALFLSLPSLISSWNALLAGAFLCEFLAGGRWHPLSAMTPAAEVRPLAVGSAGHAVPTDLYTRASLLRPSALVLVHGLSPRGKDDPRLRAAAALLARAGWAVAVPTVDGLTALRLRPGDALAVEQTVSALRNARYGAVAILAISVGAGPAFVAAAEPRLVPSVSAMLALGGYASAVELLRYTLTGGYCLDETMGRRPVNEDAIGQFVRANRELLDSSGRRLVENRDPWAVDRLVQALPADTRRLLTELSPSTYVAQLRAPLFLIHGKDDPAVPFTESLRLDRAARAAHLPVTTAIVGSINHVEPGARAGPSDLAHLATAFYGFAVTSRSVSGSPVTSAGRAP
jgi:fermentation-respiration switch protein FrsA (DUF1100 family)